MNLGADRIEEPLVDVEELVSDLDERVDSRAVVKAFDALELDFGGALDLVATYARNPSNSARSETTRSSRHHHGDRLRQR